MKTSWSETSWSEHHGANIMERDIKDVIGILMRVLDGGEVSHAELDDVAFEVDDEFETGCPEAPSNS